MVRLNLQFKKKDLEELKTIGVFELAIKNCLSSFKLSIKDIDIIAIASNNHFNTKEEYSKR